MFRKPLFPIFLIFAFFIAIFGSTNFVSAAPPNGVDHLRGRWDGVIQGLYNDDQPYVLMLDEYQTDPDDASATLYNGCMSVGSNDAFAPVSARFVSLGSGNYDMTLFGTTGGSVIKLIGTATTNDATVTDDPASGMWQTAQQEGDWSAYHHDRRDPKCPSIQLGEALYFNSDTYGVVGIVPGENNNEGTLLEGHTNIVSSAIQVGLPDGSSIDIPFYTDIFSPTVDFITEFRYLGEQPGLPVSGGSYSFKLLDVFGNPIFGAEAMDGWTSCDVDAPRNASASLDVDGVLLQWDAVLPAPGFDPSGFTPLGFYQIALYPLEGGGEYGSNDIHVTSHLIPYASFGGFAPGSPDGNNFGSSLLELDDGLYAIDTISFAEAPSDSIGHGLECQVRDVSERIQFTKSGEEISFSQGEIISDTLIVPAGDSLEIAVVTWVDWPYAQDIFDAVQMALDDYGAVQGFGLQQNQFDEGCNVQAGEDVANAITANAQNAGIVGPLCSTSAEGALPVLDGVNMVMISYGSTRPDLPNFGPNVFNRVTVMDPDFDDYWHAQISGLQSVLDWEADFAIRYGRAPNDVARYAYDAAQVLLNQINAVSTVDLDGNLVISRSSLATAVRGTTGFLGVTGSISLDADGNRIP